MHLAILAIGVKMFLDNFTRLFKQYRFERNIRTILTLTYKYKLIVYSKVFIFAFLYSLGFIIMNIIQISYHMNYFIEGSYYIYYLNVVLELFFAIILSIIFFPLKNSLLYKFKIYYDYDKFNFLAEIKSNEEKSFKIINLTKEKLQKEYLKNEYPLILIEPFTKTNNLFNAPHLHVGIAKRY